MERYTRCKINVTTPLTKYIKSVRVTLEMPAKTLSTVKNFMNSLISGVANYYGGKRKLLPLIAKHSTGRKFLDLFMGSGVVSLWMKAKGMEVTAVDRSMVSQIFGRALIQNDDKKLTTVDLQRLYFSENGNEYCQKFYYPTHFELRHAEMIDQAVGAASTIRDEETRSLSLCLVAKMVLSLRAFGDFTNESYMLAWNARDEEEILHRSPAYYKLQGLTSWELINRTAETLNASIFPNGMTNRFVESDVFSTEIKPIIESSDTIYLDPPYYGSRSYENYYDDLNQILSAGKWKSFPDSSFNSKSKYFESIERLLTLSRNVPRLLFSYGGYSGIAERDRIAETIKIIRGGRCEIIDVPFAYSVHRNTGNGSEGKEFLIVSDN